jgi:hypothetical protein
MLSALLLALIQYALFNQVETAVRSVLITSRFVQATSTDSLLTLVHLVDE